MTSYFETDSIPITEDDKAPVDSNDLASESETEDEEVRMNCIGGFRGVDDSDMNTTDHSEDGDDLLSEDEMGERIGVVQFVTNHVPSKREVPLVCPKANPPAKQRLSPHEEEGEDDESVSDGDRLFVGARRASRSLGTPTATSEGSVEEEDGDDSDSSDEDIQAIVEEDHHHVIDDLTNKYYDTDDSDCSEAEVHCEDDTPDFELTDILESLGDALGYTFDESESSGIRYIGVMVDREIDLATVPKTKRVLSCNNLAAEVDAVRSNDKSKRVKSSLKEWSPVDTSLMSTFSLGPPALQDSTSTLPVPQIRHESPIMLSSDDEDLDRQLGEELDDHCDSEGNRNGTPVPLLTPPGSPLTVEVDGNTTTVCEWPSNLTVENAMQAANELRPMSPTSLENLERDDQDRVATAVPGKGNETTFLTPLLRSIYVGMD